MWGEANRVANPRATELFNSCPRQAARYFAGGLMRPPRRFFGVSGGVSSWSEMTSAANSNKAFCDFAFFEVTTLACSPLPSACVFEAFLFVAIV